MAGRLSAAAAMVAVLASVMPAPGAAEPLPDPTRPPAGLQEGAAAAPAAADVAGPVLQSVMISPERLAAIIDGNVVELGERFGDARLVKVTETGVTLRSASGAQELRLFPSVEKRPARAQPAPVRQAGGKAVDR